MQASCMLAKTEGVCRHHLSKAQARLHIVDGLLIAQASLDAVVADIRRAADGSAASKILQEKYKLDTDQVSHTFTSSQSCCVAQS